MPALILNSVSKTYDGHKGVDDLSIEVQEGTIYGLLGPNGAGKTTTIRMILDIIAPDTGEILIFGGTICEETKDRIGYLPEERGFYLKMKLGDLLLFLAAIKGVNRRVAHSRIDYWLGRLELSDWMSKPVEALSKGMQQKAQFIATLLGDPDLLILDEPFSGLDPVNTLVLKDILLELKERGKCLILSTHNMEQAEKLCERICLIDHGRMVLEGDLSEIKSRFGRNTVQIEFDGNGEEFLSGSEMILQVDRYERYAEVHLREDADPQVFLREAASRMSIRRFEISEPSLNDIFIEAVR